MTEWGLNQIQKQLNHLEDRVESHRVQTRKESSNGFLWLIVLSNIIFVISISHIDLKHDFNALQLKLNVSATKQG